MNIGESDDTITLLRWLTADNANDALEEKARAAAARLADRSRARLMAGLSGEKVLADWPAVRTDTMFAQCRCRTMGCPVHGSRRG